MADRHATAGGGRVSVRDRPWGITLGSFGVARLTGELAVLADDGKRYVIALRDGGIVGASSPLVADSVARVALTSHLVSSTQVAAIAKAVTATDRDEVDVVAELAKLSRDQADTLRRRLLAQRVARTFAIDRGDFVVDASIVPPAAGQIDVGAAIYLGARMYLSEQRLGDDLRRLGSRFVLRAETVELARFGFTDDERPLIQALRIGASLPELDAKHREIAPRTVQAVIYALVACELCDGVAAKPRTRELAEPAAGELDDGIARSRTTTFDAPTRRREAPPAPPVPRTRTEAPPVPRTHPEPPPGRAGSEPPVVPRARTTSGSPPNAPRTITARRTSAFTVRETIAAGIALIDRGADHFALLGVARDAPVDAIRSAYVALACQLHPDKLPELAPAETKLAQRLFGHVNIAFAVLCDPDRRASYSSGLAGGPPPAPRLAGGTDPVLDKARAADEAVKRGLAALRRDDLTVALAELVRATELVPGDVDHAAALAWARFCASSDKQGIAPEVRRALDRAIQKSPNPATARFYLGRVERMLGRVREALHHFHEVIVLEPGHADAAAEIRLLEPRRVQR